MIRLKQVLKYGWSHAGEYADKLEKGYICRIRIFIDILYAYNKYKMWSNQYLHERFYEKDSSQRKIVGYEYREKGIKRDLWQKDFRENRKFLLKYSSLKYELAHLRCKRNRAYQKRFNAGPGLLVEYDVNISRQHYLDGSITIGKDVLFAKHVFIDYSGEVIIGDNVAFSHGAMLESHTHASFTGSSKSGEAIPRKIVIENGVIIGANSIILDSCSHIGRKATITAGTVVRNKIPPYAIVLGNPGKIIGFKMTPKEVAEFEKDKYSVDQRTDIEQYKKVYNKYFVSRCKEIRQYISNYGN
jgi:acetyltransferase-like isoleucine patch superfamily enzyme